MSDSITSVTQNSDGSFAFGFTFDNGNGIMGNTVVILPAPSGTPAVIAADGVTVVTPSVAAVPYTYQTAQTAVLPIAAAQKTAWMNAIGSAQVVGTVTL